MKDLPKLSNGLQQELCSSANKHRQALALSHELEVDQLKRQLGKEIEHSSSLNSQKGRLQVEYVC